MSKDTTTTDREEPEELTAEASAEETSRTGLPGYLRALLVLSLVLSCALLPLLVWLWTGGAAQAGLLLEEVPLREAARPSEEQQLYVARSEERGVIRIPLGGAAVLREEVAARQLRLTIADGGSAVSALTITADTELLRTAALYRSGREREFVFTLTEGMTAELSSTETEQVLRLRALPAADATVLLLDVRGAAEQTLSNTLAERVRELLAEELPALTVYLIGNETEPLTEEGYTRFLADCAPDLYLRLSVSEAEPQSRALCNPRYFLPGLDGTVLAERVLRAYVRESGNATEGVLAAEAGDALNGYEIPAAALLIGTAELQTEAENEAAARGIARGLREALQEAE